MFKNISNFSNTSDYLSILNGALLTDLIFMFFLIFGVIKSKYLRQWYHKFSVAAVAEDVLILVIGVLITRFLYKYIFGNKFSIVLFTLLAVIVQVIHDILFYLFITWFPKGKNNMMDTFKQYAKEVSYHAILADSCMITLTSLLSSYFASLNVNINIVILILTVYMIPYTVYTF